MDRTIQAQPHAGYGVTSEPDATDNWADSSVLYLLTCYDVWSATPPRGCEPAIADPAEEMPPAA